MIPELRGDICTPLSEEVSPRFPTDHCDKTIADGVRRLRIPGQANLPLRALPRHGNELYACRQKMTCAGRKQRNTISGGNQRQQGVNIVSIRHDVSGQAVDLQEMRRLLC